MHFSDRRSPCRTRLREVRAGAPRTTDEGWPKRGNRGTTAAPPHVGATPWWPPLLELGTSSSRSCPIPGTRFAPPRAPPSSSAGRVAPMVAGGHADTRGDVAARGVPGGQGTPRAAMRGPSSWCVRGATGGESPGSGRLLQAGGPRSPRATSRPSRSAGRALGPQTWGARRSLSAVSLPPMGSRAPLLPGPPALRGGRRPPLLSTRVGVGWGRTPWPQGASASARTAGRRARRGPKGRGGATRPWPRATAGARTRGSAAPGCPPGSGTRRARDTIPACGRPVGERGGGVAQGASDRWRAL